MDRALSSLSKLRQKSSKDLTFTSKEYPSDPACYELLEDCGRGVSATVHRAVCKTTNEIVAVKKMNLERVSMGLDEIIHEAQTMKSYHHPNVLPLYTSFVHGQDLWMVTPFMSGGSVLHIMKYRFPTGLDEVSIATIMKYVLMGLEYVHKNNGIHRDVKAGNILMDREGVVRIGDFGVAATPSSKRGDDEDWKQSTNNRNTFAGTPCWMAPEVMEQLDYDKKADIWSVGITLLELANGHAPFAKFPPMKILLMTLQNPPPQLDDQPGRPHFSKHMRNIIARCLQKDPKARPTATDLLQDKFFKQARDEEYLARTLLDELPALGERVQMIREGKAATNAAENDRQLERSQEEYKRGVSSWNFDVASLKKQAEGLSDDSDRGLQDRLPQGGLGGAKPGGLGSIAEEPAAAADGDGSGNSSRRSTDDAAGIPPAAPPLGVQQPAPQLPPPQQQQQQPPPQQQQQLPPQQQQQPLLLQSEFVQHQQQLPPLQTAPLHKVSCPGAEAAAQQAPPAQLAADAAAAASDAAQQQQQSNMRRASSAFAGSHALAAAAATAGSSSGSVGSSSNAGLLSHSSEPSVFQASGVGAQQHSSSGMPPPAPYAGSAFTGLGSGSLPGAGASSGGSSTYCLSPPTTSPPMSRESSSQGPLSSLATPEALQLRAKSKGRFQVYEHGVPAPPLSPGARGPDSASASFSKTSTAAAAAAVAAADAAGAVQATTSGSLARMSDSTGLPTDTPRAGRQVLNPAEAAELKAAAVAATAAVGTTGGGAAPAAAAAGDASAVGSASTCPTPPPGASAAAVGLALPGMGASGTPSVEPEMPAAPEPKKKGRFKIIEEENPSRAPSKVPSSADLSAVLRMGSSTAAGAGAGGAGSRVMAGSAAAVLPDLVRLHEQSISHANALARVIDSLRASSSGTNLAAAAAASAQEDAAGGAVAAALGAAAAQGSALPPRKPVAAAGAGGAGAAVGLSRGNSSRLLLVGPELRVLSLQQLLQDSNGDAMDVAEKLYERVQDLERQVSGLEAELRLVRAAELRNGGSGNAAAAMDSADASRAASRRTSVANLALSAASPTAATAAVAGGSNGMTGVAAGGERHSSGGGSGGGTDSGGGAPPAP